MRKKRSDGLEAWISDIAKKYPILSYEEERAMIKEHVDRGEEDKARELLVLHNVTVIGSCIKPYIWAYSDPDDAWSLGMEKLVECSMKFDFSMEVKFVTYAFQAIRRHVQRDMNSTSGIEAKNTVSGNMDIGEGEDTVELFDLISSKVDSGFKPRNCDPRNIAARKDMMDMFDRIARKAKITERQKDILIDRYVNESQIGEISHRLGVTKQYVSFMMQNAMNRIRRYVFNMNFDEVNGRIKVPKVVRKQLTWTDRYWNEIEKYYNMKDKARRDFFKVVCSPMRDET